MNEDEKSAASPNVGDTVARIWDAFEIVTAIGSPLALGAALLFYFGWSRSQAQARQFGADVSVFDMSANELALRSLDAVFFPSLLLLFVALAGFRLHRMLLGASALEPGTGRQVWIRRLATMLARLWMVLLPAGLLLLAISEHAFSLALPFLVGLAIFGQTYGTVLRRRASGETTRVPRLVIILVAALATITLFWQTERISQIAGEARSQDIKNNPAATLHEATVYSTKRLYITAPGVTEVALPLADDSYRYRYEGIFLLQRSGGKYFFISGGWNEGHGQLIVIPDNDSVRLDFAHSRSPAG